MKKFFLVAGIAVASTGFAQKVNNKLSFQKGQKLEVVVETNKTSNIELMGQSMDTKMNSTINELIDVADVNNSGATLEHSIKRMKFDVTNPMGPSQSYDSDKDADRNGEIGKMLEKTLKSKYTVTIDPMGKIVAVKSDKDTSKSEDADMADLMASQLGMNSTNPKVGEASSFKILPDKAVGVGDTWMDSSAAEGQTRKTTYTVKNITDKDIVLDYNEVININTTQQLMGAMEATIKTTDKTTGTITLDRATGLLKQKTGVMQEEGTMEAQGQTIPMKGTTNISMTVSPAK